MYSGKPDEGDVRWVELEQLSRMKLAGSMETMLKVFLGEDISEHFFSFEGGEWVEMLK